VSAPKVLPALAACLAATGLAACQSTQATSALRAKDAKRLAHQKGLRIRAENRRAVVTGTAVVHDTNGTAAVVEVRNRGAAQAAVPIGLAVRDGRGRRIYANDSAGLDRSLVTIALLRSGEHTFWVNDQIPPAQGRLAAEAKLGVSRVAVPGQAPGIAVSHVAFGHDSSGVFASGLVTNRSEILQKRLVIACIARRGGRIVAAGRAVVEKLAPEPSAKPTRFTVYFIGNPRGGRLSCSAPPTVLE
jgi:hypothetical protein